MQKPQTAEIVFFWILFLGAGAVTALIFSPYITSLFLALVLAIIFTPLYRTITDRIGGRSRTGALATSVLVSLVILLPVMFAGVLLFQEVVDTYGALTSRSSDGVRILDNYAGHVETFVQKYVPTFTLENSIDQYLGSALGFIARNLNIFFSQTISLIFHLIIMICALFLFFHHGARLRAAIIRWSPLSDRYDEGVIDRIGAAVGSVVKGSILIALIQGALTGIGLFLFGVPNPALWGVVATFSALIPSVGTAIVNIPAVIFLFLTGHVGTGIGLLLWAVLFVGVIDNVLRPILIERGIHMHPFIIFLSVIGGISFFGPIGFIAGPVIIAFFFALTDIYPILVKGNDIPEV